MDSSVWAMVVPFLDVPGTLPSHVASTDTQQAIACVPVAIVVPRKIRFHSIGSDDAHEISQTQKRFLRVLHRHSSKALLDASRASVHADMVQEWLNTVQPFHGPIGARSNRATFLLAARRCCCSIPVHVLRRSHRRGTNLLSFC